MRVNEKYFDFIFSSLKFFPLKNDQPHIHEMPVIYIPDEKGILSL